MGIVGISGYINSGKDLTGKCIQYLIAKNKYPTLIEGYYDLQGFVKNAADSKGTFYETNGGSIDSGWEIRKFAKKLKQIASILTGIDIKKFEDQEFKKKTFKQLVDEGHINKHFLELLKSI
jgi:hypothetical protein